MNIDFTPKRYKHAIIKAVFERFKNYPFCLSLEKQGVHHIESAELRLLRKRGSFMDEPGQLQVYN
jgi:hypothetical protein